MTDDLNRAGDVRPLTEREKDAVEVGSAPATAAAGAVAGATAGLATMTLGPFGAIAGAIVGAVGGAAVGAAGGQAVVGELYTSEHDAHYRSLYERAPERAADRGFDAARPAYQFGHLAAQYPEYAGRDFGAVEPELRRHWSDDLRTRAGEWDAARRYVETGYTYARSRGLTARRDPSVVGSAGSAVDPTELARARSGLPSTDEPAAGGEGRTLH
jgi:hypothetical protein